MRKITFKFSNGGYAMMNSVFKDIPELETILTEWDFRYESNVDNFIDVLKKYLIVDSDIVAPMAIITDKVIGASIKHNGQKYYLIIRELEGGE